MAKYVTELNDIYAHSFYHPIWKVNAHLVWGDNRYRIEDYLNAISTENIRHKINDNSYGSMFTIRHENQEIPVIVLPFEWDDSIRQISTLCHEINHALIFIFRYMEICLPKDLHCNLSDEENYCYHIGWMTDECMKALRDDKSKYLFKFENEKKYKQNDKATSGKTSDHGSVRQPKRVPSRKK